MKRAAKVPTRRTLAGLELRAKGFGVADHRGELLGAELPAERCFAWSAEQVGLHLWIDRDLATAHRVRGWFAGGRVSTIAMGNRYCYSASRWLADPIESAEELHAFAEGVQEGCLGLGIPLKGSPGSAALALWRRYARTWPRTDHEVNLYAEEAIYGGRNELLGPGEWTKLAQWDRSSAYPSHLCEPLPCPGSERWTRRPNLELEGITEAVVAIKPGECTVPVLPCHISAPNGDRRTVYPWGRFHGRWPNVELRAALERGYRVEPVSGITFSRVVQSSELQRFAQRVWQARKAWPLSKRLGVALVGKLHAPRVARVVKPFGPFNDLEKAEAAARKLGRGTIIVDPAHVALVLETSERFAWYVCMPVAAHVLARARLELLQVLEKNPHRIVACATDSVTSLGHERPKGVTLGQGLGQWRLDYQADHGTIYGPTAYSLEAKGKPDKVRTAGVSRALASKFLAGERVRWETRAGLMARSRAGKVVERAVRATNLEISRELSRDEYGWPEPPYVRCATLPDGRSVNRLA